MKKTFLLATLFISAITIMQAQYPLISIHDLQYVDAQTLANGLDSSLYENDTVEVQGIVNFDPCAYGQSTTGSRVGTYLETAGGGPWSGVHVLIDAAAIGYTGTLDQLNQTVHFIDNFQPGNVVHTTGIVTSFSGVTAPVPGCTQLLLLPTASTVTGLSAPPAPAVLTIDQFMLNDGLGGQTIQRTTGEQWEGVYVEIDNPQVVDVSAGTGSNTGRWFWSIQDGAGDKMKIRDLSGWVRNDTSDNFCTSVGSYTPTPFDISPYTNATLSYVKGTITEFCSAATGICEYYLTPLTLPDIGAVTAAPPTVSNVNLSNAVPTTFQTQTVSATITDIDGTVASATLYYSVGLGNTTYQSVSMSASGSTWSGTIPAQGPDSSYVNYWIKAFDNDGNHTNYPDSLATASFYWVINSGINSIQDIQYNPTGSSAPFLAGKWIHQNMNLTATVMATTGFYDLGYVTIQDGSGAWHGIFMRGQNLSTLVRGDRINITEAKVFENFNVTFLDSTTYAISSSGNTLYAPVTSLNTDSVRLAHFNQTEPYEGSLCEFDNVFVVSNNPDGPANNFGEWAVDANTTDTIGMRCDDYSNDIGLGFNTDSLQHNQSLAFIKGIMYYSFGNWKLLPRNRDDIAGFHTPTGIDEAATLLPIQCYPNPANDAVNVRIPMMKDANVTITLTDLCGKNISSEEEHYATGLHEYTFSVATLPAGMYLLNVSDGVSTVAAKVLVQH